MKKSLVFVVVMICCLLCITACGNEIVAEQPVPTEPAVTTELPDEGEPVVEQPTVAPQPTEEVIEAIPTVEPEPTEEVEPEPTEEPEPEPEVLTSTGVAEIDKYIENGVFDAKGFSKEFLPDGKYGYHNKGHYIEFRLNNLQCVQVSTTALGEDEALLIVGKWGANGDNKCARVYTYSTSYDLGKVSVKDFPEYYISLDALKHFWEAWGYIHEYDFEDWEANPLPEPFEPW